MQIVSQAINSKYLNMKLVLRKHALLRSKILVIKINLFNLTFSFNKWLLIEVSIQNQQKYETVKIPQIFKTVSLFDVSAVVRVHGIAMENSRPAH